jgi:hypothetical protein
MSIETDSLVLELCRHVLRLTRDLDGQIEANGKLAISIENLHDMLDPPICRLQMPDGNVPMNVIACANGWHDAYKKLFISWTELRSQKP